MDIVFVHLNSFDGSLKRSVAHPAGMCEREGRSHPVLLCLT